MLKISLLSEQKIELREKKKKLWLYDMSKEKTIIKLRKTYLLCEVQRLVAKLAEKLLSYHYPPPNYALWVKMKLGSKR